MLHYRWTFLEQMLTHQDTSNEGCYFSNQPSTAQKHTTSKRFFGWCLKIQFENRNSTDRTDEANETNLFSLLLHKPLCLWLQQKAGKQQPLAISSNNLERSKGASITFKGPFSSLTLTLQLADGNWIPVVTFSCQIYLFSSPCRCMQAAKWFLWTSRKEGKKDGKEMNRQK